MNVSASLLSIQKLTLDPRTNTTVNEVHVLERMYPRKYTKYVYPMSQKVFTFGK